MSGSHMESEKWYSGLDDGIRFPVFMYPTFKRLFWRRIESATFIGYGLVRVSFQERGPDA